MLLKQYRMGKSSPAPKKRGYSGDINPDYLNTTPRGRTGYGTITKDSCSIK